MTVHRLYKLQKKSMRIITVAPYNAHAEPIFKSLNILKISDIFTLFQFKFYHKLINNKLPSYFTNLQFEQNQNIHHYYPYRAFGGQNKIVYSPRIRVFTVYSFYKYIKKNQRALAKRTSRIMKYTIT